MLHNPNLRSYSQISPVDSSTKDWRYSTRVVKIAPRWSNRAWVSIRTEGGSMRADPYSGTNLSLNFNIRRPP